MTKDSQNGWRAILNPVLQGVILVLLVGAALWLGMQVYHAVVG